MDGLRGLAILLVVACHLVYVNPQAGAPIQFIGGVIAAGASGVTVFFTLSGFLIALPFWRRKIKGATQVVPPGYGWRRFWKIYPPLALSVLLLLPIYLVRSSDSSFIYTAAQWLVGWPLLRPVSGRLNPVMWSLVVELHFYALLPLLFLGLKKLSAKTCLWLVSLALLLVPTGFRWWNLSKGVQLTLHPEINVHFPAMLDAFFFGVLLAGFNLSLT